jgi:hypothetical protein
VIPAWVVPTARAVPWAPIAGVAACLVAVTAVAAAAGTWPDEALDVAAAALAAAAVAGLRDPAAALLAAVPTSPARRRARRLALLVPVMLAVWLASLWTTRLWEPAIGWPLGPLAALVSTGLAVAAWAPERIAVEAGVAAPLVWFAAAWAGPVDGAPAEWLFAWQHHPWLVTAAALAALLMRRHR